MRRKLFRPYWPLEKRMLALERALAVVQRNYVKMYDRLYAVKVRRQANEKRAIERLRRWNRNVKIHDVHSRRLGQVAAQLHRKRHLVTLDSRARAKLFYLLSPRVKVGALAGG